MITPTNTALRRNAPADVPRPRNFKWCPIPAAALDVMHSQMTLSPPTAQARRATPGSITSNSACTASAHTRWEGSSRLAALASSPRAADPARRSTTCRVRITVLGCLFRIACWTGL